MLKRSFALLVVGLLAVLGLAGPAVAGGSGGGHPHFVKVVPYSDGEGGLNVFFKEAGLGKHKSSLVNGKAFVTVKYACTKDGKVVSKDKFSAWVKADEKIAQKSNNRGTVKGVLHFTAPEGTCGAGEESVTLKTKWTCVKIWDECTHAWAKVTTRIVWKADKTDQEGDCGCDLREKIVA